MNKENRGLLINALSVLIISAMLLLTFIFLIPTSPVDKIFNTKVRVEDKEYFRLPKTIEKVENVYKGEELLGTLYTVKEENMYGFVKLQIAIDAEGLIIGIGQNIKQDYPKPNHAQEVYNYINSLSGSKIASPQDLDGVAEPTTIITIGTIKSILNTVAIHSLFKDPEVVIPEEKEVEFIRNDEVEGINVKVYKVTNSYVYVGTSEGKLSFEFSVDSEGILRRYEEIDYEHSGGNFKDDAISFLNSLVNNANINNINDKLEGIDGTVGSTNTAKGLIDMLDKLAKFIKGDDFEEDKIVEFIRNDEVEGINVKVYKVTNSYVYVGTSEGKLSFEFSVDSEGILRRYEEIDYEHSGGNFKDDAISFLNSLVNNANINNINDKLEGIDGTVGSTNTAKGLIDMLDKLAEFIKEGN